MSDLPVLRAVVQERKDVCAWLEDAMAREPESSELRALRDLLMKTPAGCAINGAWRTE